LNVISEGETGELYMTYAFQWLHADATDEQLAAARVKEKKIASVSVESSIKAIREMVVNGKIK